MIKFICDECGEEIKDDVVLKNIEESLLPNYTIVKNNYKIYCVECGKKVLGEP